MLALYKGGKVSPEIEGDRGLVNRGPLEMERHETIGFTVNDALCEREEHESKKTAKRAIDEMLLDSNWRLMSGGVHYRLGILSGHLKAYESEEDLAWLINGLNGKR